MIDTLSIVNFVFGNIVYDKLQETHASFYMGRGNTQFSLLDLNFFLFAFSILGFYFVIKDILGKVAED